MQELLSQIARAKEEDLEPLLKAVLARYRELYPDWEICTFSLDRTTHRGEQIDRIIAMLESMKTKI